MAKTQKKRRKPAARQHKEESPQVSEGVHRIRVKTIGIGGGGGSIVGEIAQRVPKVDFVVANTDLQALKGAGSKVKTFAFGQELTRGLGCGMDAELGERAAKAEKERIKQLFAEQDLCILVASLGGGTGSGSVPVFAQAAQEAKCLTLGVFTLPFEFEGERRAQIAKQALERVRPLVNAYIVIPNERIFQLIDRTTPLRESLSAVNKQLGESLQGLVETVYLPGVINIDFADLRSLLEGKGKLAYLHSIKAAGPMKTQEGAKQILSNPLLEYGVEGAERMLFTVASDRNMKMQEVSEISGAISSANSKARIIFGISQYPELKEKVRVTLFATGCKGKGASEVKKPAVPKEHKPKQAVQVKVKKKAKKQAPQKKKEEPQQKKQPVDHEVKEAEPQRRSGLDVREAQDREMKVLEEREQEWEVPAFLQKHFRRDS